MELNFIFSIVYYFAFSSCLLTAVYLVSRRYNWNINKYLFVHKAAFSIWGMAYAQNAMATELKWAIFWNKLAILAWIVAVVLFIAGVYEITACTPENGKSKYTDLFFRLLTVILLIFFFLPIDHLFQRLKPTGTFGYQQFMTEGTPAYAFELFFVIAMLIVAFMLDSWKRNSTDEKVIRRARRYLITFFIFTPIGLLAEYICKIIFSNNSVPQISMITLCFLGSLATVDVNYLSTDRKLPELQDQFENDYMTYIGARDKNSVCTMLGFAFVLLGIIGNAIVFYVTRSNNIPAILVSVMSIIIGALIVCIPNSAVKSRAWDLVFILSVNILSVAVISVYYRIGIHTVIVFPVIIMILSIIYKNMKFLLSVGAVSVITTVYLFNTAGGLAKRHDNFFLVIVLLVVIFIAAFVHISYIDRIEDIKLKSYFKKIILDILGESPAESEKDVEERINNILKVIADYTKADRAVIYRFQDRKSTLRLTNSWNSPQITGNSQVYLWEVNKLSYLVEKINKGNIIDLNEDEKFAEFNNYEKLLLLTGNVRSVICVPMKNRDEIIGFMNIEYIKEHKRISQDDINSCYTFANLLCDIIFKMDVEFELKHMAYYDRLTGLPNRSRLTRKIVDSIEKNEISIEEKGVPLIDNFGLVLMDLDSFKDINDSKGHSFGDSLLTKIGNIITEFTEDRCIVSRFGGDEFLLYYENIESREWLRNEVDNLMTRLEKVIVVNDEQVFITFSCGIAIYPDDGKTTENLIKSADVAMYESKQRGKNRITFCSDEINSEIDYKAKLTNAMHTAIENKEFTLFYQPQVDAVTHKIIGAEALIRWFSPEFGTVSPGEFIPLAEDNGMIIKIGRFVIDEACKTLSMLQQKGIKDMYMGINLSAYQFRDGTLIPYIDETIKRYGIDPRQLDFEITETAYADDKLDMTDQLIQIKNLGAMVSLDDFGVKYSVINRLKLVEIDIIKIDMSYVEGIGQDVLDEGIINTFIYMSKQLGIKVLAEGVERKEQLDFLADNGCDYIQGYYFYKPISKMELMKILNIS